MPTGSPFSTVAVVVADSVGVGNAPDAADFGDSEAHTLGHVLEDSGVELPQLARLGLACLDGVPLACPHRVAGAWGRLTERGPGKDTMLGHWELMGVLSERPQPMFPDGFPDAVIAEFERRAGRAVIGNRAASGTAIIEELGDEHRRTGALIVYTSGDSVFQVAAHEAVVPPEELYRICRAARQLLRGEHAVGRVIARPFVDGADEGYRRVAGRRKDFPLPPPSRTALDLLAAGGVGVYAIGKIHDIFAGRGIDSHRKTGDNAAGIEATLDALLRRSGLIFTNLVDFDSEYGHRNDPAGYGRALEELDRAVPRLLDALPDDGCLILTADHGNDPTTPGTDHTRERVPLLVAGGGIRPGPVGDRDFADLGATLLENFGIEERLAGRSFLDRLI